MTGQSETRAELNALIGERDALKAALARANGTLRYIAAQAKAGHPGALTVVRMNAEAALDGGSPAIVKAEGSPEPSGCHPRSPHPMKDEAR